MPKTLALNSSFTVIGDWPRYVLPTTSSYLELPGAVGERFALSIDT